MESARKLWISLVALLALSFAVLLLIGREISVKAPPLPERVVTESGRTVYTIDDIQRGRQVWQSIGGMQLGSVWGHGGYVAPDWTADWQHRELVAILDAWARREFAAGRYADLSEEQQSSLRGRLRPMMRRNTFDPTTGAITVSDERAQAIVLVSSHYESLFGDDPRSAELRENYAMKNGTVADAANRRALGAFFWWTAWAATTDRPGSRVTYTNNWPSEPLVDNRPPATTFIWSAFNPPDSVGSFCVIHRRSAIWRADHGGELEVRSRTVAGAFY